MPLHLRMQHHTYILTNGPQKHCLGMTRSHIIYAKHLVQYTVNVLHLAGVIPQSEKQHAGR